MLYFGMLECWKRWYRWDKRNDAPGGWEVNQVVLGWKCLVLDLTNGNTGVDGSEGGGGGGAGSVFEFRRKSQVGGSGGGGGAGGCAGEYGEKGSLAELSLFTD